jgi:NAD(P)-dependent dehydrogenase (short-subunit alcohol dehydrogenase family)
MWENAKLGPEAFDLSGKRALVVGAASTVGRAIALALSEAGADVTVTSAAPSADEARGVKRLAKTIAVTGPRREPHSLDASLGTAVQVMVRQVVKEMGGIDILVTAPDLFLGKASEKTSDLEWGRVVNANLSSVFYACRAAGREMVKQGWSGDPTASPSTASPPAGWRTRLAWATRTLRPTGSFVSFPCAGPATPTK